MLNKKLAEVRGLPPETQDKIQALQDNRQLIKNEMEKVQNSLDDKEKIELIQKFRANEVELQKLWGFDDDWHMRFMEELKISGCNCPYLDNKDSRGVRVFKNQTCKWHNLVM